MTIGALSTGAGPDEAIAVTGATAPIDLPVLRGGVPGHASVLAADLPAAVLLAAAALVRVAGASGHETGLRSRSAAEEGPATLRRLLAEPRDHDDRVRSGAARHSARPAVPELHPHPTGNPL
ncbi:hypothetical protein [Nonomuraea antimicrobica]|uniref:hypothetical protein n=1 Tax=Nonomuraea antimicrobica TaxID=561173 RepID=UPI0031EC3719